MSFVGKNTMMNETNIVSEYLLNGGSNVMAVDGTTPVTFSAVPASGKVWVISRLMVYYEDATAFSGVGFGNLPALTNGVSVMCNGVEFQNWKDDIDVQITMFDADGKAMFTKLDRSLAGRWTFEKHGDDVTGMTVTDTTNGFGIKIQDPMQTLSHFRAKIQGVERNV